MQDKKKNVENKEYLKRNQKKKKKVARFLKICMSMVLT